MAHESSPARRSQEWMYFLHNLIVLVLQYEKKGKKIYMKSNFVHSEYRVRSNFTNDATDDIRKYPFSKCSRPPSRDAKKRNSPCIVGKKRAERKKYIVQAIAISQSKHKYFL